MTPEAPQSPSTANRDVYELPCMRTPMAINLVGGGTVLVVGVAALITGSKFGWDAGMAVIFAFLAFFTVVEFAYARMQGIAMGARHWIRRGAINLLGGGAGVAAMLTTHTGLRLALLSVLTVVSVISSPPWRWITLLRNGER